jgi:xanthine dehydrogenase YagS FAD-binding subunit
MLPSFAYHRPTTIDDALAQLARGEARPLAGGTDLLGCLRDRVLATPMLVALSRITALHGITSRDGGLHIGALTTISEIAADETIRTRYAALAQAAASTASPQLRNQGTLGGNLCQKPRCWYYRGSFHCLRKGGELCYAYGGENQYHAILGGDRCFYVHPSDIAAVLVALDATVHIAGSGYSRQLSLAEFFILPAQDPQRETALKPDELVTGVSLPQPPAAVRSSYRKVRARGAWDFALAGVALALRFSGRTVTGARVVLSGVAPVPWRALEAEVAITGTKLDDAVLRRAVEAAVAKAEPLAGNSYKVALVRGLLEEQLAALAHS